MKKLLLILIALPMIGFGQQQDFRFYLPSAMDDRVVPLEYQDRFPLVVFNAFTNNFFGSSYNALYPDSLYGTTSSGALSGKFDYNSNNNLEYHLYAPTFFDSTSVNITYNTNNLPINVHQVKFSSSKFDTVFYDSNNLRTKIIRHKTTVFGSTEYYQVEFIYNASNQVIEMLHYDNNQNLLQTDNVFYDTNGDLDEVVILSNHRLKYHYNLTNKLFAITYWQNNNIIDTIASYEYNMNGKLSQISRLDYDFNTFFSSGVKTELYYDALGRIVNEKIFESNNPIAWALVADVYYVYNNITPSLINQVLFSKKNFKVTDLLGRETKQTNQPLFYIYEDGTVEKRIVIE